MSFSHSPGEKLEKVGDLSAEFHPHFWNVLSPVGCCEIVSLRMLWN